MRKRFECEHNWIIDNNKRNTKESLIVYDEEWNTLNDLCELLNQQDQRIAELEEQLAESEKSKESYRLQNEQHHLQLLQFYSRLGVEAFGADIHEKALETLMIMKEELEEKNGVERALSACNRQNDEFSDMIKKLVNEKEELKQQLAEKEEEYQSFKKIADENVNYLKNRILEETKNYNQDKISFAIEQIEQLKKLCQEKFNWWENSEWEGDIYDKSDVSNAYFDIEANIDNQINELKGGE